MFDTPDIFMDPKILAWRERQIAEMVERRLKACVDWATVTKWSPQINVKASTFKPPILFPDLKPSGNDIRWSGSDLAISPSGKWCYAVKRLPKGRRLALVCGGRRGDVLFDDDVLIPAVHTRKRWNESEWDEDPYMSITPMEIMTLRPGTKRARGHVGIAWIEWSEGARREIPQSTITASPLEIE
jgi:hypothetical protein